MKKTMTATYNGDSEHHHLFDMDGGQKLIGTIFVPKESPIPKFVTIAGRLRKKEEAETELNNGKKESG